MELILTTVLTYFAWYVSCMQIEYIKDKKELEELKKQNIEIQKKWKKKAPLQIGN